MSNVIESLFVSLGFEVNTEKLDQFKQKTEELRQSALTLGALFTSAAGGIGLLVHGVASSLGDIASFAELNEVSSRSVAALGKIAEANDGSLEGMKSTIQNLNKTIGEAALGIGRGAMTFEKLGLAAKKADGSVKNVDDILAEVADKMQGLSRQEQIGMAEKLGIDPQFVKVLEKGSENLAKLREEAELLNPFTEQDYQLADQVDKLFVKAKATIGTFTKILGVSLLPTVKEVLETYLEWFKASRKATSDVFISALKLTAGAVGTLWDWVVRLVSGLKSAYDWITKFKVVTYAAAAAVAVFLAVKTYDFVLQLGAAFRMLTLRVATFNATALIIPAIIGGVILALGLLIDDYVNWKEGNDSVLGGLVEQFPILLNIINGIEKAVGEVADFWIAQWANIQGQLGDLGSSLWNLVSVIASIFWPIIKTAFIGWSYIMAAVIPLVASLVGWIAESLVSAISGVIKAGTWLADTFTTVFSVIKSGIDLAMQLFDSATQKVTGFIEGVVGAINKVGELLGLTGGNKINVGLGSSGAASSSGAQVGAPLGASGGVLGTASNSTSTSTVNSTQITGTTIQINSSDPTKAGESVRQELERMNKQSTRNGQSAVAL